MKRLVLLTMIYFAVGAFTQGCSTNPKIYKPYTYNGALSELHRQGNPNTRPAVPASSGDLYTPDRYASRVCVSRPIFNNYGEFVRYHVECR